MKGASCVVCFWMSLLVAQICAQCPWNEAGVQLWSSPSTWPNNIVPAAGSGVVIPSGAKIVYDIATPGITYGGINVTSGGQLIFDGTKNVFLEALWIWVQVGASFRIGSATCPYSTKATITLFGPRDNITSIDGKGNKGIIVAGSVEFYGVPPKPTWTRIAATVNANDTSLTVQEDVDWKAGDRIVLASTDYYQELSEDLIIASIVGRKITVTRRIAFLHWGANDQYAEVGVLNRNILIQGDPSSDASFFGAHAIMYGNSTAKVVGVEFTRMGQRGVIGKYPFHFHVMGDQTGKNQTVSENSFHHNYQRCFTIHGTSVVTVKNNVGFNVTGHCYFLEEGSETQNYYEHNLGIWVNPGPMIPTDAKPSVFWITNPNNTYVNNTAVGGVFGFWFSCPVHPLGMTSYQTWVWPRNAPIARFDNNVAHSSSKSGIHIDDMPKTDGTTQLASLYSYVNATAKVKVPIINYLKYNTAYKNREHGIWLRGNPFVVQNSLLMDNGIGINFPSGGNLLLNSVIIGETPNIGTPGFTRYFNDMGRSRPMLWEIDTPVVGFESYDDEGYQFARNVTFINFTTNGVRRAGAVSAMANGEYVLPANNILTGITMINSNVWAQEDNKYGRDGPSHIAIHDADGSLTGSFGSYVVSNNSIMLYANNCTQKPEWNNFYHCQTPEDGFTNVVVINKNTAGTDFGTSLSSWFRATFVPFGRPDIRDSVTGEDPEDDMRDQYVANVISRKGYVLQFPHPTPPTLQVALRYAATGEWIVVALSYPANTNFTITTGYEKTPVNPVSSLSLLSPLTYFFNSAEQYLYVMYQESNSDLISTLGFPEYGWGDNYIDIKASCGKLCTVNGTQSIPPTYPDNEDKYKAVLRGCAAGTSSPYQGVSYLRYNPINRKLTYLIYHNIPEATSVTIQGSNGFVFTHPVPQSPIRGALDISWQKHNDLWNGNWSIIVTAANSASTIKGSIGCVGACSTPPMVSAWNPCASVNGEVVMYNDTLNTKDGWEDWSYNTVRSFNNTSDGRCGARSALVKFGNWGEFTLHVGECVPGTCRSGKPYNNVTNFAFFQFNIRSPSGPLPVPLTVYAHDYKDKQVGADLPITSNYVDTYAIENTWARVRIPLKDMGFTGNELIGSFTMYLPANLNDFPLLFDDIKLVPNYADPITQAPSGSVKAFADAC